MKTKKITMKIINTKIKLRLNIDAHNIYIYIYKYIYIYRYVDSGTCMVKLSKFREQ